MIAGVMMTYILVGALLHNIFGRIGELFKKEK